MIVYLLKPTIQTADFIHDPGFTDLLLSFKRAILHLILLGCLVVDTPILPMRIISFYLSRNFENATRIKIGQNVFIFLTIMGQSGIIRLI